MSLKSVLKSAGNYLFARAKEPSTWAGAAGVASTLGYTAAVGPLTAATTLVTALGTGGAGAVAVALPAVLGGLIAHKHV